MPDDHSPEPSSPSPSMPERASASASASAEPSRRDAHPPMPRDKRGWHVAPAPDGRGMPEQPPTRAAAAPHARLLVLRAGADRAQLAVGAVLPAVHRRTAGDGAVQPVLPGTGQGGHGQVDLHQGRHDRRAPSRPSCAIRRATRRRRRRSCSRPRSRRSGTAASCPRCCRKRACRSTPNRRPRASRCWRSSCSASARRC